MFKIFFIDGIIFFNFSGDSKWLVARNEAEALKKNDYENYTIEQETDVLDTWFSSALYPFVAMGWPKNTSKLGRFSFISLLFKHII